MMPRWYALSALLLAARPLPAELLHVELSVGGLDCISCAQSVDRVLKRIKGVDTASFRTADAVAILDLKPGNSVTMEQIRDAVKGIGYTPKAAKIAARGEARQDGGKWIFRVSESGAGYALEIPAAISIAAGEALVVEGSLADAAAPLKVSAIRRDGNK
jgi:cation transport ATPase